MACMRHPTCHEKGIGVRIHLSTPLQIAHSLPARADSPGVSKIWTLFESKKSLEDDMVTCLGNMSASYQKELAEFFNEFPPLDNY